MMSRSQISLEPEIQRKARQRASDMGGQRADPSVIFDLGSSDGSNIAKNKDAVIAEAFASGTNKRRRRSA
jgi:hypothetical protein